ncbi:MAG: arginine--tRNA ligase [Promethearchaeota archaeon]
MEQVQKTEINELFQRVYPGRDVTKLLERPPKGVPGDFGLPCFFLAKELRRSPVQIAEEVAANLRSHLADFPLLARVESNGPYVNFFVDPASRAENTLRAILASPGEYGGAAGSGDGGVVVVEYPSPNTNKPLHVGHVRNLLLGQTISRVLKFRGRDVRQVNLYNDRGIHICKSMLAYQRWGNGSDPKGEGVKPDHFVGKYYSRFTKEANEDPSLNDEAAEMLRAWEAGDPGVRALWKKMNEWAYEGFRQTFEYFGVRFDRVYHESDLYEGGKREVLKALEAGTFERREDGAVVARLQEKYGLPDKVLLRADGTTVYMTQDVYLARRKWEDFKPDLSILVVGNAQTLHFQRLFKVLELLGVPGKHYHFAYGMISLPEGRMGSRYGNVVLADDLIAELRKLAERAVRQRHPELDGEECRRRATAIAMAALRFKILLYDPAKNFVFDPEESIGFEGETGPYVQYVHARASSILEKAGVTEVDARGVDVSLLSHEKENALVELLERFPTVVGQAENFKLHLLARYLLDLCQAFNEFYHNCDVIHAPRGLRDARLALVKATKEVVKTGLELFGIEPLEKM